MSTGGYPMGAQYDKMAPYNQPEPTTKKVDICVSVCYTTSISIEVPEDYNDADLRDAARESLYKDLDSIEQKGFEECEFDVIEE